MTAALFPAPLLVFAQTPKPALPAPALGAPTATAAQPAAEPYSYSPEGRRDPFVNLMRGVEAVSTGKRSDGLGGLTTTEVMLRGVLQSRGTYIALVQGTEGKTFTAHVNDRLADGTIRSISPQGMVIMQEVNDPLSLVKVKEVRKGLRADDVKQ